MTRRLRAALTALAVLLTTVGLAAPASAAEFSGTVTSSGSPTIRLSASGTTASASFSWPGLSPAPTSGTLTVQHQADGGPVTTLVPPFPITNLTTGVGIGQHVSSSDLGYLFITLDLRGPGGEQYVRTHQVRVEPGLFDLAGPTVPVSGTPRVGSTLTVDAAGYWNPAPGAVSYEWRDVDGGGLLGTGPSYPLTADDLGRVLYVQAAASRDGYVTSTPTSAFVGAVGAGQLAVTTTPQVDGGLRVGVPATVSAPVLDPAPDSLEYQWAHEDGTPVPGATSATFAPTPDLLGDVLYAEVTAHRAGFEALTLASNIPGAVGLDEHTLVSAPTLPGSAVVGTPLTVTAPTFDVAPDSVGYQWFRTPDVAITGATGTTYTPTTADVGAQLYVVATAERAWTQPYVVQSTMTGAVALRPFVDAPVPTITGVAVLGTALVADAHADAWAPAPERFTYQWFRASDADPAGAPVPGATDARYVPTATDAGHWFFVEVTAHGTGMASHVVGSAPSRTVRTPWAVPADGAPRAEVAQGGRLRVTLHGLVPGVAHELELHSTPVSLGTVVPDANGSVLVDVTVPSSVPAGAHTLVVLRDGARVLEMPVTVDALVVPETPVTTPVAAPAAPAAAAAPAAPVARPALATTGARAGALAGAAAASLAAGAALLLASRRRRT